LPKASQVLAFSVLAIAADATFFLPEPREGELPE